MARYSDTGAKQWCSYYGGSSPDASISLAYVGLNQLVLVGGTNSTNGIATVGAAQATSAGGREGFAASFTVSNGALLWGTYNGTVDEDQHYDVKPLTSGYFVTTLVRTPPVAIPVDGVHRMVTYTTSGAIDAQTQYAVTAKYHDRVAVRNDVVALCTKMTSQSNTFGTPNGHQPVSGGGDDAGVVRLTFTSAMALEPGADQAAGTKSITLTNDGEVLRLTQLHGPISVALHDISGALVGQFTARAEGGALTLPSLRAGVYIGLATDAAQHQETFRFVIP